MREINTNQKYKSLKNFYKICFLRERVETKHESLEKQAEKNIRNDTIGVLLFIGIYAIAANFSSFLSTSNKIKSNGYFDKKSYEDRLRKDTAANSLEDVFIDAAFKTFYEFPGRPGRNLAYWYYKK